MLRKQRRKAFISLKNNRRTRLNVEQMEPRVLMDSNPGVFTMRDFLGSSIERMFEQQRARLQEVAAPNPHSPEQSSLVDSKARGAPLENDPSTSTGRKVPPLILEPLNGTGTIQLQIRPLALGPLLVATFTDPDGVGSSFANVTDWGDGTPGQTACTLTLVGNTFYCQASHNYTKGIYKVTTQIQEIQMGMVDAQTTVISTVVVITGLPPDTPPTLGGCNCSGANSGLDGSAAGADGGNPKSLDSSAGKTRYSDGVVSLPINDISSSGFGVGYGQTRLWTNGSAYDSNPYNGSVMVDSQLPFLLQNPAANEYAVVTTGANARLFDLIGQSSYQEHHFGKDTLAYNAAAHEYLFTDTTGAQIRFFDFSGNIPYIQWGHFKSYTDPDGNVTAVTALNASGEIQEVQRSNTSGWTTVIESYLYNYIASGAGIGLLQSVTLRRQVNGGAWNIIRQTQYSYYDVGQSHGNYGD